MSVELQRLEIRDGDVIVVRPGPEFSPAETENISRSLGHFLGMIGPRVVGLVLPPGLDIEHLPEARMRELGWQRIPPPE